MELLSEDDLFQRLVEIAKSRFRDCLNILFVNHRLLPVFTIFPNDSMLGLIDIHGPIEKAEESISLAKSKFSLRVIPTLMKDLSPINYWIKQLGKMKTELKPDILPELINRLITSQLTGPITFVEKNLGEGLVALLLENLMSLWRKQCRDIKNTRMLIERLSQRGLIQPWLQINVCSRCQGFELVFGSYPLRESLCSKCNVQGIRTRVYLMSKRFNKYKMRDEDLPLFIYKYLQTMLPSSIKVQPFKWFGTDTEVDICVEDVIGIETKTFLRDLPAGEEYMKGKTGKLIKKLKRYYEAGIKRVIVITSLPKGDSRLLEDDLMKRLENENIMFESVKVIPGIIDALLNALDSEIRELLKSSERT